jgi:hypothetical protein
MAGLIVRVTISGTGNITPLKGSLFFSLGYLANEHVYFWLRI